MTKYYCNPINVPYAYNFNKDPRAGGKLQIDREAADPTVIEFKGRYYLFPSMNLSVWVSDDMVNWESHKLPDNLPLYDYAPDARVCGDWVYFSASSKERCDYFRTQDIINGPYEKIKGTFDWWDPNLFFDDDGRVYFYWGCSNQTPVWGVELDPITMKPLTERVDLLFGDSYARGYERMGVDNCEFPRSEEEVEMMYQGFLKQQGPMGKLVPKKYQSAIRGMFTRKPFIEGAWMDKHDGKYYLQYAAPGAEYNVYCDGYYVSDSPLGPFELGRNNPFSYHPGGFMPGAGHGSTIEDRDGRMWHTSTMRISVNHQFERRVGIWPAGFDADGELFCNQNYGDWPIRIGQDIDPWADPDWYLLNYKSKVQVSSYEDTSREDGVTLIGENLVNEDSKTMWKAASNDEQPVIVIDMEETKDVRAIQLNFADFEMGIDSPGKIQGSKTQPRFIDPVHHPLRWILEASEDGQDYFVIEDKSQVDTDLPHDLIVREAGIKARFIRLTIISVPYDVAACMSGIRIFGIGNSSKPAAPEVRVERSEDRLDFTSHIKATSGATGYNILWGHDENKLYHSYQIYVDPDEAIDKRIGALVAAQDYYVRVDSFNDSGITQGPVMKLS